ncbi:hypothetical protein PAPHI01_2637 [Pancytospora philotis]|nr:hypothetical protein PAPHI01_2637 [Pancytospora philotis]
MLITAGGMFGVLLHLVCYASALAPSEAIDDDALLTLERWLNPGYRFVRSELLEVGDRLVEFFESPAAQEQNTSNNTRECFRRIRPTVFTNVENACHRVLAALAKRPRLYTRLLRYYSEDPATVLGLHKFFTRGLAISQHADTKPADAAAFDKFLGDIASIPDRVSTLDYNACIVKCKFTKHKIAALMLAKASWNVKAIENELRLVMDLLRSYRPRQKIHLALTMSVVRFLYEMGFLMDKDLCTDIFSKQLLLAYECRTLDSPKFFKRICYDDRAGDWMLEALIDLWGAGSVQWDHKTMQAVQASSRMALGDFYYYHRSALSREAARVASLILSEYALCQADHAGAPDLSSWPALSENINALGPKLIYTVYYLGQKGLLFILDSSFRHFFDILDDGNLVWLMEYSSKEHDTAAKASIDDMLRCLTHERRGRLYQWVKQQMELRRGALEGNSAFYKAVQDVHYRLESYPYSYGSRPQLA